MKKKLFLTLIPAFLILSACQAGPQNKQKDNIFLEDTLAHEEIFGGVAVEGNLLKPRKLGSDPVVHPDNDPSIGVQYKIDDKGNADDSDDVISFRFVAAVAFTGENIAPTNAVWTRTVSSPDGKSFPIDTGTYASSKAYTKISNGGSEYSINDFNTDNSSSYTHFVVYTLRNIPLKTYGDYYVSSYLTLSGEGGVNQTTKAVVITVDPNGYVNTYNPTESLFFMVGSWSATPIAPTTVRTGGNKASFEGISIAKGATAVIKEFYNTKLYVKNAANFVGENNHSGYYFTDENGAMKTNYSGIYNLFLNDSDQIHTTARDVVKPLYVYTKDFSWWGADGRFTGVWAFNNETHVERWFELEASGDYLVTTEDIDPTVYSAIDIVEMKNTANYADQSTWWSNKNNQTNDTGIPHNQPYDCAYIKDGGAGTFYVDWAPRA